MNAALDELPKALHDLGYSTADATKNLKDGPTGTWPFIAKRYSEPDVALHVHVQFRSIQDAKSCDLCLTFERAIANADLLKSCSGLGWRKTLKACGRDDAGQMNEPVPVEVRQTVKKPERIVLRLLSRRPGQRERLETGCRCVAES